MAITESRLFGLEVRARKRAFDLRESAKSMVESPMRDETLSLADDFDQIGDLLVGLQGCWAHGGDAMVRAGYRWESQKYGSTYVLEAQPSDNMEDEAR